MVRWDASAFIALRAKKVRAVVKEKVLPLRAKAVAKEKERKAS